MLNFDPVLVSIVDDQGEVSCEGSVELCFELVIIPIDLVHINLD